MMIRGCLYSKDIILEIVDTDLVLNDHFQREQESDELWNNETAEDDHHLNAFELLSSLHKEKEHDKLDQRYIDVTNGWTKNDDKISNTFEIENFLKTYESVDIKKNVTSKNIILSNEQSEVLDKCRYQLNKLKNINDCDNKKFRIKNEL